MFEKISALGFPFYKFYYDKNKISKVYEELLNLEYYENANNMMWSGMKENGTGDNLHSLPQFKDLFLWFAQCLDEVKKDMRLTCDELTIASSWANLNKTNQSVHPHHHPNCFISSNYYASGIPNDKTVFYVENPYFKTSNLQPISSEDVDKGGLCLKHEEATEPGKYIVFHPTIIHESQKNSSMFDRITMACDAFPEGLINKGATSRLNVRVL